MKASLELNSRPNRNGLYDIFVRIQDGNQRSRKKTPYAVKKNHFDSKKTEAWISSKNSNYAAMNKNLAALLEKYTNQIAEGQNENPLLQPKTVITTLKTGKSSASFIVFMEQKIELMLNYNHRKGYRLTLNHWLDYTGEKKLGDLTFKQITPNILKGFENYLRKKMGESSCYTNMKRIRAMFNQAITDKVIGVGDYIFKGYKMPSAKSIKQKEKLSPAELKEFMAQKYEAGSLTKNCQQAFFLSYNLAGVRIEDILTLTWNNVSKERISYTMEKTGELVSYKITSQIKPILDYFRSIRKDKNPLIVPILEPKFLELKVSKDEEENEKYKKQISAKTSLCNKCLKKIAEDACIDKKITNHVSRHTFASIAAKNTNGNILFVQEALKHRNSKTTQAYLKSLDIESMDKGMEDATKF